MPPVERVDTVRVHIEPFGRIDERQFPTMPWRPLPLPMLVGALVVLGIAMTRYVPSPVANPTGSFAFAALGDAPYDSLELRRFRLVLRDMEAHDLRWVLHVGDIFWRPCSDDHYRTALAWLNSLRHPVIYTPGDNEWTDCWEGGSGSYTPRERLASLRRIFFGQPRQSLGGSPIPLVTQADRPPFQEFVENVRWTHARMMFATVHLVGSRNGLRPFPGRTKADDEEVLRRTEAAAAWLRETFAEATANEASAVILGFHGTLGFGVPSEQVEGYEPFTSALEEVVDQFGKPVLAIHGDAHEFTVDQPLVHRTTKRTFSNFTRLEVPGSPDVGWVHVVVTPGNPQPFAFHRSTISRWKFW
jgi:hypothetical protein